MSATTAASGRHRQEHRARALVIGVALAAGLTVSAAGITAAVVTAGAPPASVSAPAAHASAPAVPVPVVTVPAPQRAAHAVWVTVRAGQCLWTIAAAHHVTWRALYRANRRTVGSNPGLIYPGERLRIPSPKTVLTRR